MTRRLRRRKSSNSFYESNDSTTTKSLLLSVPEKDDKTKTRKSSKDGFPWQSEPDTWMVITLQVLIIFGSIMLCLYTYYCFDHFHYHLTRFYAEHVDDHHAQHLLGHKLLKNRSKPAEAFQWFRRSADKGHAHSAYNLAVGHLSGYRTDVRPGEVRQLLRFAAKNGVEEAKELLRGLCRDKPKHCDL